ncbi:hypothetical protein [Pseudobutyrivibrio sp.]|uniref:hypothetical protein n=1 Tax=Pseudobutyrivibrio sp. TaxID=2014367 RepID=UPI0038674DE1
MKKIVIDISDKAYAHTQNLGCIRHQDNKEVANAINAGKVIPVFETNGDMIQYMLGQFVYSCNLDNGVIEVCLQKNEEEIIIQCSEAWWNAPYKEMRK